MKTRRTTKGQRNTSENIEAEDIFDNKSVSHITPRRQTFGDLMFFDNTPNNSENMENEERQLAPALLAPTPLAEVQKDATPKTPSNKARRKTPTLRKRKQSTDTDVPTPVKVAKVENDENFETPKATPAARKSIKRKLPKVDEEISVLQPEEDLADAVISVADANQPDDTKSGGRPRRKAAVKAEAKISLLSTPSTTQQPTTYIGEELVTPKAKPRSKLGAKKEINKDEAAKKVDVKDPPESATSDKTENVKESSGHDQGSKSDDIDPDKIFESLQFILTSAPHDSSSRTFAKREVRKQIESRGGNVVETFESMNPELTTYLIADTFYRTHKYLTALSLSVPTVSFKWINKCVEENKLADYSDFMLDAGESETTGEVYKWQSLKGKILVGKKVAVYSRRGAPPTNNGIDFCQIWSPIVVNLGAELVSGYPAETEKAVEFFKNKDTTDYFIADDGTPQELINAVTEGNGVPVTSEWIIQTIITGELASGDESYIIRAKQ